LAKKIIVAGAGHGGLAAAALLAKRGLDVTVYEKQSEGRLGHDWMDVFAPGALQAAGLPFPAKGTFAYKGNMTFYSPNMKTPLRQDVPRDQLELKMERRDIYALLIENALACGVKIVYDCAVEAPLLNGDRVTGIRTDKGDHYGDLILDAAGLHSPLRTKLPGMCGIDNMVQQNERLFAYRIFYDRAESDMPEDLYKVCLLPEGKKGLAWVAVEEDCMDLFIGRFSPFDMDEVERSAAYFRQMVPQLGTQRRRGGQFVQLPVRHPLPVMVCDGYAAIGDSAFMTMPVVGNGIANNFLAAGMLADAVLRDGNGAFSAETLWPYQLAYYKKLGSGFAVLACIKTLLTKISPEELDYIFEKGILTAADFTIGADSTSIGEILQVSPAELLDRAKNIYGNKELMKKILSMILQIGKVTVAAAAMPKTWNKQKVFSWANSYRGLF
jgi:flavin-dependent dehydrogenase